jgi:hypothetical protein
MRLIRFASLLLMVQGLAACVAIPSPGTSQPSPPPPQRPPQTRAVPPSLPPPPPVPDFRQPAIQQLPGLEGIIRQDGAALVRQFGQPRLDVREGDMRKLQFTGRACVLDIYLYPLRPNAEPVATYVEARRASDGQETDRLACINALRRQ